YCPRDDGWCISSVDPTMRAWLVFTIVLSGCYVPGQSNYYNQYPRQPGYPQQQQPGVEPEDPYANDSAPTGARNPYDDPRTAEVPFYKAPVGPVYVDTKADPDGVEVPSIEVFYDQLKDGSWYDDPTYGYVFVPAAQSYQPYSNGYWKFTDYGF